MSFLYAAALLVGVLVGAPIVAHLLRRRRAEEKTFPAARLVPPSPPVARQPQRVDDRALFAVRVLSVLALALLGATPFVRCSGLALGRTSGASIAMTLVLDDSLSMQAKTGTETRWDRARKAARDLLDGAREGDAVAIVLAGAPARVALAATSDLGAARAALDALRSSHRATDLDGAVAVARALLHGMPQIDRRVVLLTDGADGQPSAAPLGASDDVPVWVPPWEIADEARDCAVIRADRQRDRVTARVACSAPDASATRWLEVRSGDKVVGRTPLPPATTSADVTVDVVDAPGAVTAWLSGSDAIAADDAAPVLAAGGALALGVVADPTRGPVATGGPPPVEQALVALELEAQVRPLPAVPERLEDLGGLAALLVDDPPGLTPEARRSLAGWIEHGGVALVALGPHAAAAQIGAGFEPLFPGGVTWAASPSSGLDPSAAALFGPAAVGLADLVPHGRATIDLVPLGDAARVVARWADGAPFLVERNLGRGLAFVLTLPLSTDASDLALRPAFLGLLELVHDAARARGGARRTEVGTPWAFEGAGSLEVLGPDGEKLAVTSEPTRKTVTPDRIGTYAVLLDGEKLARAVGPAEREIDLRPRAVASAATSTALGEVRARIDASPYVAGALLVLMIAELMLRIWARRGAAEGEVASPSGAPLA